MGVVLDGRGAGGNMALDGNGVREEVAGKYCGVCRREDDL